MMNRLQYDDEDLIQVIYEMSNDSKSPVELIETGRGINSDTLRLTSRHHAVSYIEELGGDSQF
jgi:cobalamin biosynthesis protein CobT